MRPEPSRRSIFHIAERATWCQAIDAGEYQAATLKQEGFIHCSERDQVLATAERFFHGQSGLVLVEIDLDLLPVEVRYEPSPEGEFYPHIYGPVTVQAVRRVMAFEPELDGTFSWPRDTGKGCS